MTDDFEFSSASDHAPPVCSRLGYAINVVVIATTFRAQPTSSVNWPSRAHQILSSNASIVHSLYSGGASAETFAITDANTCSFPYFLVACSNPVQP